MPAVDCYFVLKERFEVKKDELDCKILFDSPERRIFITFYSESSKKTVDDLECSPVSYEDCKNTVVDDPYLEEEEQCEDVEFDECVDVEEQVPIQVCKVVDPDRTPVINREIEGSRKRTGGRRTGNTSRPVRRK